MIDTRNTSVFPEIEPAIGISPETLVQATARCREQFQLLKDRITGRIGIALGAAPPSPMGRQVLLASLPPVYPEWLGSRTFLEVHRVRFPYVAGAMAHGIASQRLVVAMARAEMLAFFGSAGLRLSEVEKSVIGIKSELAGLDASWGANLIHSPHDPQLEEQIVDLYLSHGVQRVCASAFMRLTPGIVRYACTGLSQMPDGSIRRSNYIFAKLSRPELARLFMSPPPPDVLAALVRQGALSQTEASLAARVPVAEDITVEADSAGHTDNRPLGALLPAILALRDELQVRHSYDRPIRVGAAGGIGTPSAAAAAFALGAAYILTGSVNQATLEAGTSDVVKEMLAGAELTDVAMAPSPDMFEMGVRVQVLKRGTMFSPRAALLYELYRSHERLEDIPADLVSRIEREIFRRPLTEVWEDTRRFFATRSPREVERAELEPKYRMALVFRWYVGLTSHWAIEGDAERGIDYQIWCGPAMGAFNRWVQGSFLADLRHRSIVQVARNLLEGAAVVTRAQQLRSIGLPVPDAAFTYAPRYLT